MLSRTSIDLRAQLAQRIDGAVLEPGTEAFTRELATFNTAIVHQPDFAVGVASIRDIQEVIAFSRRHQLGVSVLGGGHSVESITSGILLSTKRLSTVEVDPAARTATLGAGVRWEAVVDAAADHDLHPVTGSSPHVGAVGYLLGGGLGPLARSHGVSSDYVVSATVVSGTGAIVEAGAGSNPDLLWALRGGKKGLGVVTDMTVMLAPMASLYGGSLVFDGAHVETVLRGWFNWTKEAHPDVTTSIALLRFPDLPMLPEPIRGRHVAHLRFAYPGGIEQGAALADPLRALAPVEADHITQRPTREIGRIHNDPTEPGAVWIRGMLLGDVDEHFATVLLDHVGAGRETPFNLVEIRHLGSAVRRDVAEGSAFNGREATFALSVGALNPATFNRVSPEASRRLHDALEPWRFPENSINFLGTAFSDEDLERAWSPETRTRLDHIRQQLDPDGIFANVNHAAMAV